MQKLKAIALFSAICLTASLTAGVYLISWSNIKRDVEPTVVDFAKGTTLIELSTALESRGIIDSRYKFFAYIRLISKKFPKFQAGLYKFDGDVSAAGIAEIIVKGDVYEPIVCQYTIPEGFTLKKIAARLEANKIGSAKEVMGLAEDSSFLKSLGVNAKSLEGYIYPASYSYIKIPSAKDALKHMVETFFSKIREDYEASVSAKGLSLNKAVTFASLIELETLHDDERSKVSEVIWSRLKKGEPIAIDAAVIYGIKDYKGDIKWKHLRDKKNPYNTRIHKGLPPTPIGSPSLASLEAVLNPTNEGYYYYVVDKDLGPNRHHFSKTMAEHNRYVNKLIRKKR